jgi:hypothetical protein
MWSASSAGNPLDARPVDPGLLEQRTALEHARDPAAAALALPCVAGEARGTIELGERAADVGLKLRVELGSAIEKIRHDHMLALAERSSSS